MINFYLDSGFTQPITQIQVQNADGVTTTFALNPAIFSVSVFTSGGEIRLFNPNDSGTYPSYNGTLISYGSGYSINTTNNTVTFSTPPTAGWVIAFFSAGDANRLFNQLAFVANSSTASQRTQVQQVWYQENNQYSYSNVQITPIAVTQNPITNVSAMQPPIQVSVQTNSSMINSTTDAPFLLGNITQGSSGSFWIQVIVPQLSNVVSNWRLMGFQVSGVAIANN